MTNASLAERIALLEAIEDIRRLKHEYMSYCDIGYPPDKLGPLFADDAVWSGSGFGCYEGRQAIESFFGAISGDITFAAHLALNEIIRVDDDRATGRWRLIMPCIMLIDGVKEDRWILGDYDDIYVKQNGKWLFKSVDFYVNINAPHSEGWAEIATIRP